MAEGLAHPKRARRHLHFSDPLVLADLVEGWFSLLTTRRLQRGVFTSVDSLTDAIETWADHWHDDPLPFVWTKTTEAVLAKAGRARTTPTASVNPASHH